MSKFTKEQLIAVCRNDVAEMSAFLRDGEFSNPSRAALYLRITEIALAALTVPQPEPQHIANAFIAAIEKEQDRLHGEDYLMDSRDCIDVIREELQRLNACCEAIPPDVQGANHATD